MALTTLPLLALAAAGMQPEQPPPAGRTIVVTATRLSDTEKALRECLARHCPPAEDIRASLAHAENLFVAGQYRGARAVTHDALRRNDRYRKQNPIDVSDLYRADGRLAAHMGEAHDQEMSVASMFGVLASTLPKHDPRVIAGDIERADMYVLVGREGLARSIYEGAEKRARAAGRPDLGVIARVRGAWLYQQTGDTGFARRALEKIASDRTPSVKIGRIAALVLLARMDRKQGDARSTDALVAEVKSLHATQPILLYAPPVDRQRLERESGDREMDSLTRYKAVGRNWIDVGFWVGTDGRVRDAEIIRGEGGTRWTGSILASVQGRIYAPADNAAGSYRIERYTYLARWVEEQVGPMLHRVPKLDIQYLDLTTDPAPVVAAKP